MQILEQTRAKFFAAAVPIIVFAVSAGHSDAAPILDSVSGHYYQVVSPAGGIDWADAQAAAKAMTYMGASGHLATITSAAEDQFILSLLTPAVPRVKPGLAVSSLRVAKNRLAVGSGLQAKLGATRTGTSPRTAARSLITKAATRMCSAFTTVAPTALLQVAGMTSMTR